MCGDWSKKTQANPCGLAETQTDQQQQQQHRGSCCATLSWWQTGGGAVAWSSSGVSGCWDEDQSARLDLRTWQHGFSEWCDDQTGRSQASGDSKQRVSDKSTITMLRHVRGRGDAISEMTPCEVFLESHWVRYKSADSRANDGEADANKLCYVRTTLYKLGFYPLLRDYFKTSHIKWKVVFKAIISLSLIAWHSLFFFKNYRIFH